MCINNFFLFKHVCGKVTKVIDVSNYCLFILSKIKKKKKIVCSCHGPNPHVLSLTKFCKIENDSCVWA